MVRHEAEALPIERGAAAGAEVPPVAGLTILGIDLECAARANHPGIGKIARPAEGAAGAALAAVAVADSVERGLTLHGDGARLATTFRGSSHGRERMDGRFALPRNAGSLPDHVRL